MRTLHFRGAEDALGRLWCEVATLLGNKYKVEKLKREPSQARGFSYF